MKREDKEQTENWSREQCSLALPYSIGLWLSLENRLPFLSLFQWQTLPMLAFMEYDVAWEYGNLWGDSWTHFRAMKYRKKWNMNGQS